ncbi:hypothetical protein FNF29_02756 [Cafeteria roenbergensis]|uniref:VWFA domain-containing protein n=1 Tax=Cafeteria roenbergensis TaxID=33653 RepID=A0A5A8CM20_CAFRO|nr:hypothetical protein FNF29_02756 [Cafeteria roenbergensis]|eukprot:KAA0154136.1 hypothetical protein FNF29_02756 [Cafeteria roenbergensis]
MGLRLTLLLVVLVPLTIGLALVGGTVSLLLAQAVPSWLNEALDRTLAAERAHLRRTAVEKAASIQAQVDAVQGSLRLASQFWQGILSGQVRTQRTRPPFSVLAGDSEARPPAFVRALGGSFATSAWMKCTLDDTRQRVCSAVNSTSALSAEDAAELANSSAMDVVYVNLHRAGLGISEEGTRGLTVNKSGLTRVYPHFLDPSALNVTTECAIDGTAQRGPEMRCRAWFVRALESRQVGLGHPYKGFPVLSGPGAEAFPIITASGPVAGPSSPVHGVVMEDLRVQMLQQSLAPPSSADGFVALVETSGLPIIHPLADAARADVLLADLECNATLADASPGEAVAAALASLGQSAPWTADRATECRNTILGLTDTASGTGDIVVLDRPTFASAAAAAAPAASASDPSASSSSSSSAAVPGVVAVPWLFAWQHVSGHPLLVIVASPVPVIEAAFAPVVTEALSAIAFVAITTGVAVIVMAIASFLTTLAVTVAVTLPIARLRDVVLSVTARDFSGKVPRFRAVTIELARLATVLRELYSVIWQANEAAAQGRTMSALARFQRASRLFQRLQNKRGQGMCRNNVGAVQLAMGEAHEAVGAFREAVAAAEMATAAFFQDRTVPGRGGATKRGATAAAAGLSEDESDEEPASGLLHGPLPRALPDGAVRDPDGAAAVSVLAEARRRAADVALLRAALPDAAAEGGSVWGAIEPAGCASLRLATAAASVLRAAGSPVAAARLLEASLVTCRDVMPALVSDASSLLGDILRDDLRFTDASALVTALPRPRDVVFLLDRSGSMAGGMDAASKALLLRSAELGILPTDRIALLGFGEVVSRHLGMATRGCRGGAGLARLSAALDALPPPRGKTAVMDALALAAELIAGDATVGGRAGRRAVLVCITDGADNWSDVDRTGLEGRVGKHSRLSRSTLLIAVLGPPRSLVALEAMCGLTTGGEVLLSPSAADLAAKLRQCGVEARPPESSLEAY